MRDAQRYRSICFGVHFTSSVGLGALGCLQNKISSALFYSRHSNPYLNSSICEWAPENRLHSLTTNRW
jgi:hypothetical protein